MNKSKIFDINSHQREYNRDHRLTVASLQYVYNIYHAPGSLRQAKQREDWPEWKVKIDEEVQKLKENNVGTLVDRAWVLAKGAKILSGRYVFSWKDLPDGTRVYKVRYVGRGCHQNYGEDYLDTYAPMSRTTSIRCLAQLAAQYNFVCHQVDVKTAYLNAPIDCEIYMEQPETEDRDNSKVWRLNKSIYGLKQSAKLWNETLNKFFLKIGFKRNRADPCVYRRNDHRGIIFLLVWVDDIVILGDSQKVVTDFVKQLGKQYQIKDLGKLSYFLGIEFKQNNHHVQMSQAHYCNTVLKRFGYDNCNSSKLPCVKDVHSVLKENINSPKLDSEGTTKYRELVGSLIYLEQITRPDISFIVNILGQQMHSPSKAHWNLGVRVLKYLKGTQDYCLNYYKSAHLELTLFGDADWANDTQDRKSQTGYCAYLSDISSPIS